MRIFVVDGNFYLHRCYFTLRTSRPVEDVLPHNFVGLIMKDACLVKATHILVAFDGPNVFRYEIYPEYKANREKVKSVDDDGEEVGKDIYKYLPAVRQYLDRCGMQWTQKSKFEADDVLNSAAFQYKLIDGAKVYLGSVDKDGYQGLDANVMGVNSLVDPLIYITVERAEKSKGVKINQMVMLQTLIGDKIDNIPEILSLAKAKAAVRKWGSFANWYKEGSKEDRNWLNAKQTKLILNKKLVEMRQDLSIPDVSELVIGKQNLKNMPRHWYTYQDLLYPKTRGLFGRK